MSNPSHTQVTCGRRRRRTMDAGQGPTTLADGPLGRERPGAIAWGEVGRREPRVAHAPVPCTDTSARWQRAAKNAARSMSTIAATLCSTSSWSAPAGSEHRNQGRLANSLTPSAEGERSSRKLHPPCFALSDWRLDVQGQRDAYSCEAVPRTRRSLADAPMCREPRVMPPGRPHGFLPPTTAVGSRRSAGCETPFELPAGALDLPPKCPVRASETAEGTTSIHRFARDPTAWSGVRGRRSCTDPSTTRGTVGRVLEWSRSPRH